MFDAVYLMRQQSKRRVKPNLTQIFLDFYDERLEVGKYVPRNMVIISPDALKMNQRHFNEMDLREIMTVEKEYYKPAKKSPLVLRMMHARLRTTSTIFDAVFIVC